MKTSVWGPSAWRFLHAVTFAYPEEPNADQQQAALELFHSLRFMIPCGDCCGHYCSEIRSSPPQVKSRDALSRWLVDLHNRVNARLGKSQYVYEAARKEYLAEESQCLLPSEPCGSENRAPMFAPKSRRTFASQGLILAVCIALFVLFAFSLQRSGAKTVSSSTSASK